MFLLRYGRSLEMMISELGLGTQKDFHKWVGGKIIPGNTMCYGLEEDEFKVFLGTVTNLERPMAEDKKRCGGTWGWKGMLQPEHGWPGSQNENI